MKFKIYDAEVELDFLDADEMDRVEAALNRVQSRNATARYDGMTQSQAIRTQCGIIFDFFDDVFGEGTHKRIFGGKCNLAQALSAFQAFNTAKEDSVKEICHQFLHQRITDIDIHLPGVLISCFNNSRQSDFDLLPKMI